HPSVLRPALGHTTVDLAFLAGRNLRSVFPAYLGPRTRLRRRSLADCLIRAPTGGPRAALAGLAPADARLRRRQHSAGPRAVSYSRAHPGRRDAPANFGRERAGCGAAVPDCRDRCAGGLHRDLPETARPE